MSSPPERSRLPLLLALVAFCVVCFVFPRVLYSFRLALMEMRYLGIIAVLCGVLVWVLVKLGPRNRE
jgi:hypothetical protein